MTNSSKQAIQKLRQIRQDMRELMQNKTAKAYQAYLVMHEEEYRALETAVTKEDLAEFENETDDLVNEAGEQEYLFQLFVNYLLLTVSGESRYADRLCEIIRAPIFDKDHRLFLFNQLKRYYFTHAGAHSPEKVQQLYDDIVAEWKALFPKILTPIPAAQREQNRIVVITLQFLGARHAPTKTAMERIYTLGKLLGKEVICINSKEQNTMKGILPLHSAVVRSVVEEYNGVNLMQHADYSFPLIQPEVEMPDAEMIQMLLEEVRNMAPWMVVVCGDRCLLGDLCAEMIPTICIPMVFSTIPKKKKQFVAVGKTLRETEKTKLTRDGYDLDTIIESVFTFEVIRQTTTLTRAELNLPEDKFLLGIIGIRLDADVKEDFLRLLLTCVDAGIHLVFAGTFDGYDRLCADIDGLREHSTYIGYQKDILALWDVLDLYVNPPRVGGGFSVAEAFCKSKPGISMNWGDVAASAGPDFCVESLNEYPDLIRKYVTDHDFYREMGEKALERSKRLFDSRGEMEKILNEAEKRSLWF